MSNREGNGYGVSGSPPVESGFPTLDVVRVVAAACRPERCEMPLHISLFFDGTGNNADWVEKGSAGSQKQRQKDSNVYRLFTAYPEDPYGGYFPMYVPGVGTPFPEIGERESTTSGAAFGAGGDGRINYGLLHVLNSVHAFVASNAPVFDANTVMALCRNGVRNMRPAGGSVMSPSTRLERDPLPPGDEAVLRKVGMDAKGGLLRSGQSGQGDRQRTEFLRLWADRIAERVLSPKAKPQVTEIFIDVFGFSRGAAEARVFCSWLLELMPDGKLCGVPAQIRFLGVFDTVASVGAPHSAPLIGGLSDGHLDWARPEFLRVSPQVRNCVHYVAMHENRASFPLDFLVHPLPAHFTEHALPGMHSDVGGGYTPQDQGRGPDGLDSQKLSQMPLDYMYNAAEAAGVPLDKAAAAVGATDPFEVHPALRAAYTAFLAEQPAGGRPIREWLLPYLAWRYQVRDRYADLAWRKRLPAGGTKDLEDLDGANRLLHGDVAALDASDGLLEQGRNFTMDAIPVTRPFSPNRRLALLEPEARELLRRIRAQPATSAALEDLFANYVHDSYAGFRPFDFPYFGLSRGGGWETPGYLRYRRWYRGDNKALTQHVLDPEEQRPQLA
ncbi:DUF2235 domain-containing protein [Luteimonas yindakuii]|nr:DUF2235 domain-containing protein [Luteimonas yindakuii]